MSLLMAQPWALWPTGSSASKDFTLQEEGLGLDSGPKDLKQPWSTCTWQKGQRGKRLLMNCYHLNMHCPLLFCVCLHMCVHTRVCMCTHTLFIWHWIQRCCLIFQGIFSSTSKHVCAHAHTRVAFYLRSQSKPQVPAFCSGKPALGDSTIYLWRRSSGYRVQTLQLFNIKHMARQEY